MSEFELTEEEAEKLIEDIARTVVKRGLDFPATVFFEAAGPVSFLVSQLAVFALGPFPWLFGARSPKYAALFMKEENIRKIIDRIDALSNTKP